MTTMPTPEQRAERIKELDAAYDAAQALATAANKERCDYVITTCGYRINDRVEFGPPGARKIGCIVEIVPWILNGVLLKVVKRKLNSEWGKVAETVYPNERPVVLP